jgi:osmoprotectant transport system ATP-binding protein
MISLRDVSKTFPGASQAAVESLSFAVPRLSLTVLLGASGSGKTTTLKLINRLETPTAGVVRVDGIDTRTLDPVALRRRCGYVVQGIGLFPHLTVGDNIALLPRTLGWSAARCRARVTELLALVQLPAAEFASRYPDELSGGQQQRVGVARALAAEPAVLLMDEPFGALDPATRSLLQAELKRLQAALQLTIVMVTHDVTEALTLADQIIVFAAGRSVFAGTPAQLLESPTPAVQALLAAPRQQLAVLRELQVD